MSDNPFALTRAAMRCAALVACLFLSCSVSAQDCAGDCDGDGAVSVGELIIGVSITLGRATLSSCPALDRDADGAVEINEVITAVNRLLFGCEGTATATPVPPTPTRTRASPTVTPTTTVSRPSASGVIELRVFRSEDGTLYYMLGVDLGAASPGIGAQVTSVVMSDGTVQAIQEPLSPADRVLTAFAGAISGSAVPPTRVRRTEILHGLVSNDVVLDNPPRLADGDFDPAANSGRGLLVLAGGLRSVSADGSGSEAVVAAATASGSGVSTVPAAVAAPAMLIRRRFRDNTIRAETLVFPNPPGELKISDGAACRAGDPHPIPCDPSEPSSSICGGLSCASLGGETPGQNVTIDDTVESRIGYEAAQGDQVDGFFLRAGSDAIVFIVDPGGAAAPVNAAAAGFLLLGSCVGGPNDNQPCSSAAECADSACGDGVRARSVAATIGGVGVQVMPPPPPTPTATPDRNRLVEVAYVANSGDDSLAVVDVQRRQRLALIPVGAQPFDVVIGTDARRAYVSNTGSDSVTFIDTEYSSPEDELEVGQAPRGLALTADGAKLVVANELSDSLSIVDTATRSVHHVLLGAAGPVDAVVVGSVAYVARTSGGVSAVDLTNETLLPSIPTAAGGAHALVVDANGRYLYVAHSESNAAGTDVISVVDLESRSVVATVGVGDRPSAIAAAPSGDRIYVANTASETLSIIDAAALPEHPENALIDSLALPAEAREPSGIAFAAGGSLALVTNRQTANLAVINVASGFERSISTGPAGAAPIGIAVAEVFLQPIATATPTATRTVSPTVTSTGTATDTASASVTPTATPRSTATVTWTATREVPRAQLLKTGQTTCYAADGAVVACEGTGQDGETQAGLSRSYIDNGDGTITDLRSGLSWEKLTDDGSIHDKDRKYSWSRAFSAKIAVLNDARFGGHGDWRLPNVNELQSLVHYGGFGAAIAAPFNTSCASACTAATCDCTEPIPQWSATTFQNEPSFGWYVNFLDGSTGGDAKSHDYAVRAVRADSTAADIGARLRTGQSTCFAANGSVVPCAGTGQDGELQHGLAKAYVDHGDGTISDLRTGLMWEKLGDDGGIDDQDVVYTWAEAFSLKIATLNAAAFGGHSDWRLPNVNELLSLVHYGGVNPTVDPAFSAGCAPACAIATCTCTAPGYYWSATTYQGSASLAWIVSFDAGNANPGPKQFGNYVRAVRDDR